MVTTGKARARSFVPGHHWADGRTRRAAVLTPPSSQSASRRRLFFQSGQCRPRVNGIGIKPRPHRRAPAARAPRDAVPPCAGCVAAASVTKYWYGVYVRTCKHACYERLADRIDGMREPDRRDPSMGLMHAHVSTCLAINSQEAELVVYIIYVRRVFFFSGQDGIVCLLVL